MRDEGREKRYMNILKKALFIFLLASSLVPLLSSLGVAAASPVANEDAFLLDALWSRYRAVLPQDKIKVGVALGGGGARGLAHIGVLKAFEEGDVPVGALSGTSVGALIGSLYAAGITTSKLEKMAQDIGWSSLTNYSRYSLFRMVITEGRLSTKNMEVYLRQQMGDLRFDQLKIPFACIATDLQTGERVVFREGEVALAVKAMLQAFLDSTGDNIVDNRGLADGLVGHVTHVTCTYLNVVTRRRQMDEHRHHFESTFIVFLLTKNFACLQKNNR